MIIHQLNPQIPVLVLLDYKATTYSGASGKGQAIAWLDYSEDEHINLGCGEDVSIAEIAQLVIA